MNRRLCSVVLKTQKRTMLGVPEQGVVGKEFLEFEAGKAEHAQKTAKLWKNIFLYSGIPLLTLASFNAARIEQEHFDHLAHHPPHPKDLPYLHIRRKPFPWGNGKEALFYNPKVQPREEE